MSDRSRIPSSPEEFNSYIGTTNSYLLAGTPTTNAVRLGILPAESAQWTALATQWIPQYIKYSDKKGSRTTAIKDQVMLIITKTIELDHTYHLLDRIAASPNVTVLDMETFNIRRGVLQRSTHTVSHTNIQESVVAALQPIGGGSFSVKCHSSESEGVSIIADADCVQYVYLIGDTAPDSPDTQGLSKDLSTKASFTLVLGASSSEKHLYIYFRWYNTKHPQLAGPWNTLQTSLIL